MQIKKRKANGVSAVEQQENKGLSATPSKAVPMSVSASLASLKKKQPSATTGENGMGPSATTGGMGIKGPSATTGDMGVKGPTAKAEAMTSKHSEAYLERIKKRAK